MSFLMLRASSGKEGYKVKEPTTSTTPSTTKDDSSIPGTSVPLQPQTLQSRREGETAKKPSDN